MSQAEITRVDLTKIQDTGQVLVLKYAKGWKIGQPPAEFYKTDTMSFEEMVSWLEGQGWIVTDWKIGARAWKYERRPVRTEYAIKKKRKEVRKNMRWYNEQGVDNTLGLDLAFSM